LSSHQFVSLGQRGFTQLVEDTKEGEKYQSERFPF
jgi:hypothetical protein